MLTELTTKEKELISRSFGAGVSPFRFPWTIADQESKHRASQNQTLRLPVVPAEWEMLKLDVRLALRIRNQSSSPSLISS